MARRKLVSQRNMDKLDREVNQTCINTGMYHTKLSIELGKHAYYLSDAVKKGCSVVKEREIIKQLKDFTKQHYISVHSGRNGTHIHVKDTSVLMKKENEELKKQIQSLQENQQRVNTANETTINNLHHRVQEYLDSYQSSMKEVATLKRQIRDSTEKNLYLRGKNKSLDEELQDLTQENDILRGDLEIEKHNNILWKDFNSNINQRVDTMAKEINHLRQTCHNKEMELVGLKGWNFEPRENIILDKKVFGFNVVISKGDK